MKRAGIHTHLASQEVKYSAWACASEKPRLDSIVKDRRKATCKDCLQVPMKLGPLHRRTPSIRPTP